MPLSFEYFKLEPEAVTVIEPSFADGQLAKLGSVFVTVEIVGTVPTVMVVAVELASTQLPGLLFTTARYC